MTAGSKAQEDLFATIAEAVFDQVRRVLPPNVDCDVTLDSRLDEIGLNSLATMEVLGRLEEAFGLRFTEDSLYDMATCRDVIEYVRAGASRGISDWQPPAPAPCRRRQRRRHASLQRSPPSIATQGCCPSASRLHNALQAWRRPGWRTRSSA